MLDFAIQIVATGVLAGLFLGGGIDQDTLRELLPTIAVTLVGSLVGGVIFDAVFRRGMYSAGLHPYNVIGSALGAVLAFHLYRRFSLDGASPPRAD